MTCVSRQKCDVIHGYHNNLLHLYDTLYSILMVDQFNIHSDHDMYIHVKAQISYS